MRREHLARALRRQHVAIHNTRQPAVCAAQHGRFRCRSLADDDGAGSAQPFHADVVAVGYVVAEQQAAPSRGQTGDKDVVLHRHGDPIERSQAGARRLACGGGRSRGQRAIAVHKGEGIQHRFQRIEPVQRLFEQL